MSSGLDGSCLDGFDGCFFMAFMGLGREKACAWCVFALDYCIYLTIHQ